MRANKFLLILCAMLLICNSMGQTTSQSANQPYSDCNRTDTNGKKQGLWIEENGATRIEQYYKDGIHSGGYQQFHSGELSILGEYTDGKKSGIWYFYSQGRVMMTFEDYAQNHDTITREWDKKRYVPDYKCYSKGYYLNGNLKQEGWLLWNKDECPESDLSIEYGEWKYYDETGNLIKTKQFN